jgi:hypothetical protein
MRVRLAVALSVLGACSAFAALSTGRASDHLDGPRAVADPHADITDVFAFTSPERPGHVVLAMTVVPFAPVKDTFSVQVDYVFRVRRVSAPQPLTLDATPLDITCVFDDGDGAGQSVTCSGPGGAYATASFGDTSGGNQQNAMRVFAGRRADPAFFDRQGMLSTIASQRASFTGQNAFLGADVLAIVVEIDVLALSDAGSALPMLAVAAETTRRAF